jgi:hypothetical protein
MATFINVGAYADNKRITTKAKLKELVKANPDIVRFDQTSDFGPASGLPRLIALRMIGPGIILSVVGPDPYESRKWYANVEFKKDKFVVS